MTYCVAIQLEKGLVFASDSRTNAGVDYVTTYSKTHVFQPAADRLFVLMSAGNLATTQQVMNYIQRDLDFPPTNGPNLLSVRYLFEAAEYIGQISVNVQRQHDNALQAAGVNGQTTFILGGQIKGQPPSLMLIYPQGNYITATTATPYLQIGESKYGKPILERLVDTRMSLEEAVRLTLVSLEATACSNAAVGAPYEASIYPRDQMALSQRLSFAQNSPYFISVKDAWSTMLKSGFQSLPRFDWEASQTQTQTSA